MIHNMITAKQVATINGDVTLGITFTKISEVSL